MPRPSLPLLPLLLAIVLAPGCPREGPARTDGDAARGDAAPREAGPPPPSCDERLRSIRDALGAIVASRSECLWDVDCVLLDVEPACVPTCGLAVASAEVVAARQAMATLEAEECRAFVGADCERPVARCPEQAVSCVDGRCVSRAATEPAPDRPRVEVPAQNSASLREAPPRPPLGDAEERIRRLWDAIVADDPARAMDLFFPREAFLEVKAMEDPGQYWDRLLARYREDIHALHEETPDLDRAEFVRFELVRRGAWVARAEEGNRLPYHACRHAWIHYRVGDEERRMEVRVLITWGQRWYVIHLSEFR